MENTAFETGREDFQLDFLDYVRTDILGNRRNRYNPSTEKQLYDNWYQGYICECLRWSDSFK